MELKKTIRMVVVRVVLLPAVILSLCLAPLRAKSDHSLLLVGVRVPLARILNVVVAGVAKTDGIAADQIKVIQPGNDLTAAPVVQPGKLGMELYVRDEVVTGPNVKVTIVFLSDSRQSESEPQQYCEVVLDENSRIRISNPGLNKLRLFWGRFVVNVRGYFNSTAGSGYAEVRRTALQLRLDRDGKGDLLALQDDVSFQKADLEEPPLGDPSALPFWSSWENLRIVTSQALDTHRLITLRNNTRSFHQYAVSLPENLSWLKLETGIIHIPYVSSADNTEVYQLEAGQSDTIPLLIKFTPQNVPAGTYKGKLNIKCDFFTIDCGSIDAVPIEVTVLARDEISVPERMRLEINKLGPLPSPTQASSQQLREPVDLFFEVFRSTRLKNTPYVSVQGGIPAFGSFEERDSAFKSAIFDSIIEMSPSAKAAAYEKLGDVYRSVGDYKKADHAYVIAENYTLEREQSMEFTIKRLDALRGSGPISRFEGPFLKVAKEIDDRSDRRLFTLAHIVMGTTELDQARFAFRKGDMVEGQKRGINAQRFFEHVLTDEKSFLSPLTKQQRSVFWMNYGMIFQTLGTFSLGENKLDQARKNYEMAIRVLRKARRSDRDNPYVSPNLSIVYTGIGNVEKYRVDHNNRKMRSYYRKAERELSPQARDLLLEEILKAKIFLDTSRGMSSSVLWNLPPLTVDEAAEAVGIPIVEGMLKEMAAELLAKEGLIADFKEIDEPIRKTSQCVKYVTRDFSRLKKGAHVPVGLGPCP